jgi:hypothetical protein
MTPPLNHPTVPVPQDGSAAVLIAYGGQVNVMVDYDDAAQIAEMMGRRTK